MQNKESLSLLRPFRIAGREMPNRLVAQAMETNAAAGGGGVSQAVLARYRNLGCGGWGLVFVEAVSVTDAALARQHGLVLNRRNLDGFKRLINAFKEGDPHSLILMQLTHAGRLAGAFSHRVKAYADNEAEVPEATTDELYAIRDAFFEAVALAHAAGADGVDIKACHGYLGGELLRPQNRRGDEFGGTPQNRARLVADIISQAVREYPNMIVGSRVSLYEGIPGGCGTSGLDEVIEDLDDTLSVIGHLIGAGAHYINVSAGIPAVTPHLTRPANGCIFNLYHHFRYARAVKQRFPAVTVIGSAYTAAREHALAHAEANITSGAVDLVGFGRQSLTDPILPRNLADHPDTIMWCTLCGGCSRLLREQQQVLCVAGVHAQAGKTSGAERRGVCSRPTR